jgi:hypothetical protein
LLSGAGAVSASFLPFSPHALSAINSDVANKTIADLLFMAFPLVVL